MFTKIKEHGNVTNRLYTNVLKNKYYRQYVMCENVKSHL